MKNYLEKLAWAATAIMLIISIFVSISGWIITLPLELYYILPLVLKIADVTFDYVMTIIFRWMEAILDFVD